MFYVEMTDTFGGESNYCWIRRFIVKAKTFRGAISKVAKETGYRFRLSSDFSDSKRYDAKGACICAYVYEESERHKDQAEKHGRSYKEL